MLFRSASCGLLLLIAILVVPVAPMIMRQGPLLDEGAQKNTVSESGILPDFQILVQPNEFLMKNGTSSAFQIVLTIMNGFIGNVTLNGTVSPAPPTAPTFAFNPSRLLLNGSFTVTGGSTMLVNTTTLTEMGLYNITVTGSSGALSHSATLTVGVTDVTVGPNGAELLYVGAFSGRAYVNGSTILDSTFEDMGYVNVGVVDLTVTLPFGVYRACLIHNPDNSCGAYYSPLGPYVWLYPYNERTTMLTIQIPNISPGSYVVTVRVGWVLKPGTIPTLPGPDIVLTGHLVVYTPPPNPLPPPPSQPPSSQQPNTARNPTEIANILVPVLGGIGAIVLVVGLAMWNSRRHGKKYDEMLQFSASVMVAQSTRICTNCGAHNPLNARFCDRCGHAYT